jgi:RHS repeat-associated protein
VVGAVAGETERTSSWSWPAEAISSRVSVTWPRTGYANKAFTGREWDTETGLYSYRARYYDPRVGRFLSEDPVRFAGGINLYAYVENNPVNRTDPKGWWPLTPQEVRDSVRNWQNPYDPPNWSNRFVPRVPSSQWDTQNRLRHCLASCLITRYVVGGAFTAWVGGDVIQDPFFLPGYDPADRRANAIGRCVATSQPGKTCEEACIERYGEMYQPGDKYGR